MSATDALWARCLVIASFDVIVVLQQPDTSMLALIVISMLMPDESSHLCFTVVPRCLKWSGRICTTFSVGEACERASIDSGVACG